MFGINTMGGERGAPKQPERLKEEIKIPKEIDPAWVERFLARGMKPLPDGEFSRLVKERAQKEDATSVGDVLNPFSFANIKSLVGEAASSGSSRRRTEQVLHFIQQAHDPEESLKIARAATLFLKPEEVLPFYYDIGDMMSYDPYWLLDVTEEMVEACECRQIPYHMKDLLKDYLEDDQGDWGIQEGYGDILVRVVENCVENPSTRGILQSRENLTEALERYAAAKRIIHASIEKGGYRDSAGLSQDDKGYLEELDDKIQHVLELKRKINEDLQDHTLYKELEMVADRDAGLASLFDHFDSKLEQTARWRRIKAYYMEAKEKAAQLAVTDKKKRRDVERIEKKLEGLKSKTA